MAKAPFRFPATLAKTSLKTSVTRLLQGAAEVKQITGARSDGLRFSKAPIDPGSAEVPKDTVEERESSEMTEAVVRAVADEIADEIWSFVDDIRAQGGAGVNREDEQRILGIRRKLKRRLAQVAELPAEPEVMLSQ